MGKRDDGWKRLPYSGVSYRHVGDIYLVHFHRDDAQARVVQGDDFAETARALRSTSRRISIDIIGCVVLFMSAIGGVLADVVWLVFISMLVMVILVIFGSARLLGRKARVARRDIDSLRSNQGNSFDLVKYQKVIDAFPDKAIEIDQAISDFWAHGSREAKAFYQNKIDFVSKLEDAQRLVIDE